MVSWNVEVPSCVWIFHHQYEVISPCNSMSIILLICGLYGCDFIGIYVAIMLVIYMFDGSSYVWLSSCSYLYMNEKCIYDLMGEMAIDVLRHQ